LKQNFKKKYDKFQKQLRAILNTLKQEKILKSKIRMENTPDSVPDDTGKLPQIKYTYYFINYRSIVNVVKYKLHKMQEKIESEERDNSNRASFVCPSCKSSYTDLQVNQLLDFTTGNWLKNCLIGEHNLIGIILNWRPYFNWNFFLIG